LFGFYSPTKLGPIRPNGSHRCIPGHGPNLISKVHSESEGNLQSTSINGQNRRVPPRHLYDRSLSPPGGGAAWRASPVKSAAVGLRTGGGFWSGRHPGRNPEGAGRQREGAKWVGARGGGDVASMASILPGLSQGKMGAKLPRTAGACPSDSAPSHTDPWIGPPCKEPSKDPHDAGGPWIPRDRFSMRWRSGFSSGVREYRGTVSPISGETPDRVSGVGPAPFRGDDALSLHPISQIRFFCHLF